MFVSAAGDLYPLVTLVDGDNGTQDIGDCACAIIDGGTNPLYFYLGCLDLPILCEDPLYYCIDWVLSGTITIEGTPYSINESSSCCGSTSSIEWSYDAGNLCGGQSISYDLELTYSLNYTDVAPGDPEVLVCGPYTDNFIGTFTNTETVFSEVAYDLYRVCYGDVLSPYIGPSDPTKERIYIDSFVVTACDSLHGASVYPQDIIDSGGTVTIDSIPVSISNGYGYIEVDCGTYDGVSNLTVYYEVPWADLTVLGDGIYGAIGCDWCGGSPSGNMTGTEIVLLNGSECDCFTPTSFIEVTDNDGTDVYNLDGVLPLTSIDPTTTPTSANGTTFAIPRVPADGTETWAIDVYNERAVGIYINVWISPLTSPGVYINPPEAQNRYVGPGTTERINGAGYNSTSGYGTRPYHLEIGETPL
jgi:hypothetical protein